MSKLLIRNGSVYLNHTFEFTSILCVDGHIAEVSATLDDPEAEVVDAAGCFVVPGFIDAHTHGAVNIDVNAADVQGFRTLSTFYAAHGTTAFQASVMSDTEETTVACLSQMHAFMQEEPRGARLLGAHLEGPFLHPAYKGAMPEHLLCAPDLSLLRRYLDAFPDVVRYLTISPELPGAVELIGAVAEDVVVAIGHSGASYAEAMAAIEAGARCATHTFNGMRLFHQHEPAIMGAVLESDIWCEAICDGRHLHPATVRLLLKTKGASRVIAVTDSMSAAGLPDGHYKLGVNDIVVIDGDAKLADLSSRAGSTLTQDAALRNLLDFTGWPLAEVLPLLTENVADALRLPDRGRIAPGCAADFVLLNTACGVQQTIVGGHTVFCSNSRAG